MAKELALGLSRKGYEITFLVPRHNSKASDEERQGSIRTVRYPGAGKPFSFVRNGYLACARLHAGKAFDLVHTHFAYAAEGPLRALPGIPHVRSFYGAWHREGLVEDTAWNAERFQHSPVKRRLAGLRARVKAFLRKRIEVGNLRKSDAIVVLSEHSARELRTLRIPPRKVRKLSGGVDTDRFHTGSKARSRWQLHVPAARRILLSIRRLAPRMGLDNLIQAMPAIAARLPDVLLLIGGRGPDREHLEGLIETTRMRDHVKMLGFISDEELPTYYQAADLFVLPTVALEGFGLVTVEALACGTPVLGTPVGATPEILRDLSPGLITSSSSREHLQDGILRFFRSDGLPGLRPEKLRQFVIERYTWDRHVAAIDRAYCDFL